MSKVKMFIAKLMGDDLYYTYKIVKEVKSRSFDKDIILYGVNKNSLRINKWLKRFCKKSAKYFIDDAYGKDNDKSEFSVNPPETLLTEELDHLMIIIVDTNSAVKKMENLFELGVESRSILYFAPEKILGSKVMDSNFPHHLVC